ncbi:unnamed protein product [Macrosiphum euphorbiae]|uniref:Uncharacterized protein n=1 Tax=Macrosiphum euphorbiae TaxID=13131 RepID=A0AAV0XMK6_9HEMI|nr:unnamed protein product [Macrosiphum euphorbiae]
MNGDTFYEWFVKTLPLLKPNAIIVMDTIHTIPWKTSFGTWMEHITDELMDELPDDDERHVLTIRTGDTSSSDCDSD